MGGNVPDPAAQEEKAAKQRLEAQNRRIQFQRIGALKRQSGFNSTPTFQGIGSGGKPGITPISALTGGAVASPIPLFSQQQLGGGNG